ncbi:hypothetical protein B4114_3051 [Geobacillus stearothermophilus]|uniref:Uncharacterized protein n=1 Tax=Geobacillus stearothermophilus TaxID=1422 RepID=A0A150ND13_GEOSE|nr:hypothetical protein B4114_3051 [Geobacillus stearothermophilus]
MSPFLFSCQFMSVNLLIYRKRFYRTYEGLKLFACGGQANL